MFKTKSSKKYTEQDLLNLEITLLNNMRDLFIEEFNSKMDSSLKRIDQAKTRLSKSKGYDLDLYTETGFDIFNATESYENYKESLRLSLKIIDTKVHIKS